MQNLYAKIKRNSKYYASQAGKPFVVKIVNHREYPVTGGPGGRYRLKDVMLFVETHEGERVKIKG